MDDPVRYLYPFPNSSNGNNNDVALELSRRYAAERERDIDWRLTLPEKPARKFATCTISGVHFARENLPAIQPSLTEPPVLTISNVTKTRRRRLEARSAHV